MVLAAGPAAGGPGAGEESASRSMTAPVRWGLAPDTELRRQKEMLEQQLADYRVRLRWKRRVCSWMATAK